MPHNNNACSYNSKNKLEYSGINDGCRPSRPIGSRKGHLPIGMISRCVNGLCSYVAIPLTNNVESG